MRLLASVGLEGVFAPCWPRSHASWKPTCTRGRGCCSGRRPGTPHEDPPAPTLSPSQVIAGDLGALWA